MACPPNNRLGPPSPSGFPAPRYIIVGYDPGTYNSFWIKDEDVVRPPNHMFTTKDTPSDWARSKSTAVCPTYGSCYCCMTCGPVDECCKSCGPCCTYQCIFYHRKTLDSITIANIMGTEHIRARANRTQAWIRTPCTNTGSDTYIMAMKLRRAVVTEEEATRIERELWELLFAAEHNREPLNPTRVY
jgi:hypothetical protein